MKLLLDQGLPLSAAALLRNAGIDTIHVGEIMMSEAEDAEIIARAKAEGRVWRGLMPISIRCWRSMPRSPRQ
jgi:predicted nuclease of predicted toxin-antitoxin system